jgi:hypothetical protein
MKIQTLKKLIESTVMSDPLAQVMHSDTTALLKKIIKVIDLYEEDEKSDNQTQRSELNKWTTTTAPITQFPGASVTLTS